MFIFNILKKFFFSINTILRNFTLPGKEDIKNISQASGQMQNN